MIDKKTESRILSEFSRQLSIHGLSGVRYDLLNWEEVLHIVFPDAPREYDKPLRAVQKRVAAALPDIIDRRKSDFDRYEADEENDLFDGTEEDSDDTPPEIAAKIAALPHFEIDDLYRRESSGEAYIWFWVKPQFVTCTDEETAYHRRDEEREKLEALTFGEVSMDENFTFLPIPPPPMKRNTEVFLTMAYEPYDDIEKGEKMTEFREYKEYYVRKLLSQPLKTVLFQRGYGGPHHDAPRQMRWTIRSIEYYNHFTCKSCPVDNPTEGFQPTFIAIDLGERID